MNDRSIRLALALGVVLPLGLAGASFAQDQAAPPPAPGAAAAPHHHRDPAEMRTHMAEHLRSVLQLQPSQDGALNAFLDAMKPPARGGPRADRDPTQHLTTPERLDRMAQRMDAQRARMQVRIAATRKFYAQLTPPQQKAFDDLPLMMGGPGSRGMGGRGMDGHGKGGGWGGRGGPDRGGDDGVGSGGPPRG
jgi:hypothetical protein